MHIDTIQVRPPSAGRLFYGLLALVGLTAAGAASLEYSQKEYVPGYIQVTGGEVRVVAPVSGVVEFSTKLMSPVNKGEPVALLVRDAHVPNSGSVQQAQQALATQKAEVSSIELRDSLSALHARKQALARQRMFAVESVNHADQTVGTARRALAIAERNMARQTALHETGMVSAAALDQARGDMLVRAGDVQAAERALAQARWQVSSFDADMAAVGNELAARQGNYKREQLEVRRQTLDLAAGSTLQVTAPLKARVTAFAVAQGDSVAAGQLLAKLTPAGADMEVLLLLSPATVARVKPGQRISLQMASFPYQTYGLVQAQVDRIESSSLLADDSTLRGEGVQSGTVVRKAYARITNVPSAIGGMPALQSGMQFRAAIEVDRKSFLAWMTWPLMKHFK